MTYREYRLVKFILRHPGQPECFYERKFKSAITKAKKNRYIDYQITGYSPMRSDVLVSVRAIRSEILLVTPAGEIAYDAYAEHRREMLSGRRFSIWMAVLGAVLSLLISIAVNLLFNQVPGS